MCRVLSRGWNLMVCSAARQATRAAYCTWTSTATTVSPRLAFCHTCLLLWQVLLPVQRASPPYSRQAGPQKCTVLLVVSEVPQRISHSCTLVKAGAVLKRTGCSLVGQVEQKRCNIPADVPCAVQQWCARSWNLTCAYIQGITRLLVAPLLAGPTGLCSTHGLLQATTWE